MLCIWPAAPKMPPISSNSNGTKERAIDALERASIAAETGNCDRPIVLVSASDLESLAPNDVRLHLDRVVMGCHPEAGLDGLLASGALDVLLPEIGAMVGFGDGEWRHKDVWKHTKQVVAQAELRLEVRYAALFHDIGKVKTRSISPDGEVHFLGHAEVGARLFDKLEKRRRLFAGVFPACQTVSLPLRRGQESGLRRPARCCGFSPCRYRGIGLRSALPGAIRLEQQPA